MSMEKTMNSLRKLGIKESMTMISTISSYHNTELQGPIDCFIFFYFDFAADHCIHLKSS